MTTAIPVLPSASIPATLDFYRALGFQVTYQQTSPNPYAATRRGDLHIHFMGIKGLQPSDCYGTCLVMVPEVEGLHQTYAQALRQALGKLPVAGFPRITRMKKGQSRFTVVDLDGNSVIYIRQDAPDDPDHPDHAAADNLSRTRFGKALRTVARLRDFKNDDVMAAKFIDVTLRKEAGLPFERARLLAARAELAVVLGDADRRRAAREEIAALPLGAGERRKIDEELAAVEALARSLATGPAPAASNIGSAAAAAQESTGDERT